MAQLLAIGDVIKATIICADSEQASYNTVYYEVTGVGATIAVLGDFAESFSTAVEAPFKAILSDTAAYGGVRTQIVFPLPLKAAALNYLHQGPGTGGVIGMARQASSLITWRTDLAGPGFRGRIYLPFPPTDAAQGGGFASAVFQAKCQAVADAIRNFTAVAGAAGATATVRQILWKKAGQVKTPVISGTAGNLFATQKRRGSYGRPNSPPTK
jgi:hypothetical protein